MKKTDIVANIEEIEDPTVRALVDKLMDEAKVREKKLQESLKEISEELKEFRHKASRYMPPTVEWNAYTDDVVDRIDSKNEVPLTKRQKHVFNKSIRLISRELSGTYSLSKKEDYANELKIMKASADKLAEVIIEFGVPEETDPMYKAISKRRENK